MLLNQSIFREYDIRGVADTDFDKTMVYKLGHCFGRYAKRRLEKESITVAVGQDCRLTSPKFAAAITLGLQKSGVKVISLGMVTTPMTYFALFTEKCNASIMVTARTIHRTITDLRCALEKAHCMAKTFKI